MSELDENGVKAAIEIYRRLSSHTFEPALRAAIRAYLAAAPAPTVSGEAVAAWQVRHKRADNQWLGWITCTEKSFNAWRRDPSYRNGRTELRRLYTHPAPTVTVKPLEWVKHPVAEAWRCDTFIGTYQVRVGSIGTGWQFEGLTARLDTPAADARQAKAAAQADYEQRIRSALIPAPARGEVLEAVFDKHNPRHGKFTVDAAIPFGIVVQSYDEFVADLRRILEGQKP